MATEASNSDDIIIAELQSRLNDLELSKAHEDISAVLRKERSEILVSLRRIMEAMKSETETGGAGGVDAISSKEIEKLREENEELKKINAKQRYRIEHLVHNLRETMQG